jgi:hypothetical protein
MKKLFFALSVMMVSFTSVNNASAQINLSVNIGSQPLWGPTGYDHVEYYYLPDVDAYYYVPSGQYVYLQGNRWVWTSSLPSQYRNFDLYNAYKVVMNNRRPYLLHDQHLKTYKNYKNNGRKQTIIRDSRDSKYYVVKGHPNFNGNNNNRPNNNVNRPNINQNNRPVIKNNAPQNSRPNNNNNGNRGNNNNSSRPGRG